MSIPEDFSTGLPQPGSDEPAALRQDIADEITDHLLCAARREHFQNSARGPLTDQEALAGAVERFGEPAAIARRLWWDAMKERIMAQRILTIMATAVAAAAIFACVLLWRTTQASRAEQTEMMQAQQAAMSALLSELKSTPKIDNDQWQSLTFRLVDEKGRPVRGTIHCTSQATQTFDSVESSAAGVAEFYFPPGQYAASVTVGANTTSIAQLLPPGRPATRTIVCPSADIQTEPLRFEVEGAPADLEIYYIAHVLPSTRQVGDQVWMMTPTSPSSSQRLLISPRGEVLGQLPNARPQMATASSPSNPNKTIFPRKLPAGAALSAPQGLPPGKYYVSLAPYVPDATAASNVEHSEPAGGVPTLRSVWWAGGSNQYMVDTQAKDFSGVRIDDSVFTWPTLRGQIAAGTPDDPDAPVYPPATPYSANIIAPQAIPPQAIRPAIPKTTPLMPAQPVEPAAPSARIYLLPQQDPQ